MIVDEFQITSNIHSLFSLIEETQINTKIKCIQIDNDPKFFVTKLYKIESIIHQTSREEIPQQMEKLEKKKK